MGWGRVLYALGLLCALHFGAPRVAGQPPAGAAHRQAETAGSSPDRDRDREARRRRRRKRHRARARRRGRRPKVSRRYRALRDEWHEEAEAAAASRPPGARSPLVLRPLGRQQPFVVPVASDDGTFREEALALAARAFAKGGSKPRPVHPRLLRMIYRAQRYFQVPFVRVISGVRPGRRRSRHYHGLAADVVLPGVDDEELAAFFQAQGFAGVGLYVRSGFVHVDVRERSYFWIDHSPPGRRWRGRPVRLDAARAADEAAVARGVEPFVEPPALKRALRRRARRRARRRGKR